jgi:hypothetical protein
MKKSNALVFLGDVIFFVCSFEVNHDHHTYLTGLRRLLDFLFVMVRAVWPAAARIH